MSRGRSRQHTQVRDLPTSRRCCRGRATRRRVTSRRDGPVTRGSAGVEGRRSERRTSSGRPASACQRRRRLLPGLLERHVERLATLASMSDVIGPACLFCNRHHDDRAGPPARAAGREGRGNTSPAAAGRPFPRLKRHLTPLEFCGGGLAMEDGPGLPSSRPSALRSPRLAPPSARERPCPRSEARPRRRRARAIACPRTGANSLARDVPRVVQ